MGWSYTLMFGIFGVYFQNLYPEISGKRLKKNHNITLINKQYKSVQMKQLIWARESAASCSDAKAG